MKSPFHRLLAFAALALAVVGGVSAREASQAPPVPKTTPEVLVSQGCCSDFSALVHRNRNGHIVRITRGGVTQNFGRGTGGRITSATSNVSGAPSFAYPNHDAQGRRTKAVTNRGDWDYTYRGGVNGDGQLQEADHSGPGNWDFEYQHDGIGRRLSSASPASNGNIMPTGNAQDALNRFLSTQWTQQRILRASLDREADVEITETHAVPTFLPGLPADPLLPLRDIVFPLASPGTQGGWTAWSITGTLEGGGDPGAAPDRKAKLAGLTWFPPAEETFTYDNAGNRSGSARWSYTYDGLNRLTRAVNKDLATAPEAYDVLFTYDAEGRRHSKTSKRYSNGSLKGETHTTWIWDGWHPVIERIIDPKSRKTITERKLVWGPDLSGQPGGAGGAGGLLLIRETNHSFDGRPPVTTDLLPLYDGSGNIVGLANPQGDLLAEYWYGPFGELLEATGPKAENNPWRWASKSLDLETGLVYFGLRYYDPSTGQWLSREPLGEGESLNLYAYCHNDPINRVDVLGACEKSFQDAVRNLASPEFQRLFEEEPTNWGTWQDWFKYTLKPIALEHLDDDEGYRVLNATAIYYEELFRASLEERRLVHNKVVPMLHALDLEQRQKRKAAEIGWAMLDTPVHIGTALVSGGLMIDATCGATFTWNGFANGGGWDLEEVGRGERSFAIAMAFIPIGRFESMADDVARVGFRTERTLARFTEGGLPQWGSSRTFYTVQNEANVARLLSGGTPWPASASRAHLGEGLYTWGSRSQAEAYMSLLEGRGVEGLRIIEASISEAQYHALRALDLRGLGDDAASAWLGRHSLLFGEGAPHGLDHVIRDTGNFGSEFFFSKDAFPLLLLK